MIARLRRARCARRRLAAMPGGPLRTAPFAGTRTGPPARHEKPRNRPSPEFHRILREISIYYQRNVLREFGPFSGGEGSRSGQRSRAHRVRLCSRFYEVFRARNAAFVQDRWFVIFRVPRSGVRVPDGGKVRRTAGGGGVRAKDAKRPSSPHVAAARHAASRRPAGRAFVLARAARPLWPPANHPVATNIGRW